MKVGTIYKCADVRPCYKKRKLEVWRKPLSNKESIACISKTGLGGHDGSRERLMRWWPKLSWEKQAHDESWCVYQPRMWRWKVVLIIIMVLVLVVAVEFPWNVMPKEKVASYCCPKWKRLMWWWPKLSWETSAQWKVGVFTSLECGGGKWYSLS